MDSRISAVRGAVDIGREGNESELMVDAMGRLLSGLADANGFSPEDIISLQITQTSDLRSRNAAGALREALPEFSGAPLFCAQEPEIEGSPERMVRVLVTYRGTETPYPVYLDGAKALRPDLFGET